MFLLCDYVLSHALRRVLVNGGMVPKILIIWYQWSSSRLRYLQCINNGNTTVLHWTIDIDCLEYSSRVGFVGKNYQRLEQSHAWMPKTSIVPTTHTAFLLVEPNCQCPHLQTLVFFNPSMDKKLHPLYNLDLNYWSIPKPQRRYRWSLGMDK